MDSGGGDERSRTDKFEEAARAPGRAQDAAPSSEGMRKAGSTDTGAPHARYRVAWGLYGAGREDFDAREDALAYAADLERRGAKDVFVTDPSGRDVPR